jgi:RNA polymerase sigma-70 factor (ECF subfamily)
MSSDPAAVDSARLAKSAFSDHSVDLRRFLLRRVRNAHDADDLAQEVFTRLLRVRDAELVRKPLAYLLGIATHVVHEFVQRRQRDRVLFDSEIADSLPENRDHAAAQGLAERLGLQEQLELALTKLPPTHRAVILLVKREGMSYSEAANATGLSVHTIEKYLVEARALLRLSLTES